DRPDDGDPVIRRCARPRLSSRLRIVVGRRRAGAAGSFLPGSCALGTAWPPATATFRTRRPRTAGPAPGAAPRPRPLPPTRRNRRAVHGLRQRRAIGGDLFDILSDRGRAGRLTLVTNRTTTPVTPLRLHDTGGRTSSSLARPCLKSR